MNDFVTRRALISSRSNTTHYISPINYCIVDVTSLLISFYYENMAVENNQSLDCRAAGNECKSPINYCIVDVTSLLISFYYENMAVENNQSLDCRVAGNECKSPINYCIVDVTSLLISFYYENMAVECNQSPDCRAAGNECKRQLVTWSLSRLMPQLVLLQSRFFEKGLYRFGSHDWCEFKIHYDRCRTDVALKKCNEVSIFIA